MELHELNSHSRANQAIDNFTENFELAVISKMLNHVRDTMPRTRRRPSSFKILIVHEEQIVRPCHDISENRRMNVMRHCPLLPVLGICLNCKVHEAVSKSRAHRLSNCAVFLAVAGSDNHPSRRKLVSSRSESTIENQLIRCKLCVRRGSSDLIEKQDSRAFMRPERRNIPLSSAIFNRRKTGKIATFHHCKANINESDAELISNSLDNRRLAHARRSAQKYRGKRLGNLRVLNLCSNCRLDNVNGSVSRDNVVLINDGVHVFLLFSLGLVDSNNISILNRIGN